MRIEHSFRVDSDAERACDGLCAEAFQLSYERCREDLQDVRYELLEEQGRKRRFVLHQTEFKRTMTGAIDRSGTTQGQTRYEYDASAGRLDWTYEGGAAQAAGGRIRIGGHYEVADSDGGARVTSITDIEVKIPLIGRKIEKLVAKEIEASFGNLERTLKDYLQS